MQDGFTKSVFAKAGLEGVILSSLAIATLISLQIAGI